MNTACVISSLYSLPTAASPTQDDAGRGGSSPDRSPLHQRADIIPLCNVFLTLNEMEHILSCYINQIVMLNVLTWGVWNRIMSAVLLPLVRLIIQLRFGIFFFPFFFFSKEEARDKHEDVLGLGLRICEVVLAVVRVGLRELWLQLACSLCALGVKCRALWEHLS